MIGGRRPLQGRKPGDRRVRVERPHAPYFRYTGKGQLTAKEAASGPTTTGGRAFAAVRGIFFGRPLASEEELGERLSKTKALAIFSSDAISSSAYATEEILRVLILGGAAALALGVWVSAAISILLVAVAVSYRQICIAYPTGGGSYTVSRRNIGRTVSLIAASALLIDYVMTVAVSTSSAVEQIVSAFPALFTERVLIGVVAIGLIAIANLRGLREAGNIFAAPTYLFIGSALLMIVVGGFRIVVLGEGATYGPTIAGQLQDTAQPITILLLLRAFAAGAVALTGTEAIATGVPAFKPPEAKNAARTLAVMAALLATLFIGITFLAVHFAIIPIDFPEKQTVIAQVARPSTATASCSTCSRSSPRAAVPGRQHQLQRVPAPPGDPRRGRAHATPVRAPRRPAGVLVRIIVLGVAGGRPDRHLRGIDTPADPALRGRRVHRLHDQPDRHGPPLAARAVARAGVAGWRSTPSGRVLTGDRGGHRHRREVLRGAWLVLVLIPILVGIMSSSVASTSQEKELRVRDEGVLPGPHREQRVIVPVNGINRAVVQAVNFGRRSPGHPRRLRDR